MDYQTWLQQTQDAIGSKIGLSADDLAGIDYYNLYISGLTPASAADYAVRSSLEV
jgi:hypothetical protein